jgi:hypothetical protein
MPIDVPVDQDAAAARGLPLAKDRRAATPSATNSVHRRHGDRASGDDEPGKLTVYVRFKDLVDAGLVGSWTQLQRLIRHENFPIGILLSANARAWKLSSVEAWAASRPSARKPVPRSPGRPRRKLKPPGVGRGMDVK